MPAGITLLELPQPPSATSSEQQQPETQQPEEQDAWQAQALPLRCRSVSLESLATGPRPLVLLAGSWS